MADGSFTGILEASTEAVAAWLLGPSFEAHQYSFFPSTLPRPKVSPSEQPCAPVWNTRPDLA